MEKKMFLGASPKIFERAAELRENQTNSEILLWGYLRSKPQGYKFRRQHPIKIFIADFYCHPLKLIIEVDGNIHIDNVVAQNDIERQRYLEENGIDFLRFTNSDIEQNFESVVERIEAYISEQKSKA